MPTQLIPLPTSNVPGAYVQETTYGYIPGEIASHSEAYMLLFSNKVGAPQNTLTFITSPTDFNNVYGASNSAAAVNMYFAQRPGNGLWTINVRPRAVRTVTIPTATVGADYEITVDGYKVGYKAVTGDTPVSILASLAQKVNTSLVNSASLVSGNLRLLSGASTVTVSANITLGAVGTAPAYPVAQDVIDALAIITTDRPQGFLCAPEFYAAFTTQSDRTILMMGLEAFAQDQNYFWVSVVDSGVSVRDAASPAQFIATAQVERALYTSPRGHSIYYANWVIDSTGTKVPASVVAIGIALRRYRIEGFRQPPAGVSYPVYGVSALSWAPDDITQGQLNPLGINVLRQFVNDGIVIYGARTLSTDTNYRFVTTRVIFNVLARSLKEAVRRLVFDSVDGQGVYFSRIRTTCAVICNRLWQAGALFGASPTTAYRVICDLTNNPALDLDLGRVRVDVYAKPSPVAEVINIGLYRTAIGVDLADINYSVDGR